MEHQLWLSFEQRLRGLSTPYRPRCRFQDPDIVRVCYWAVWHDRPTAWACCKDHWPPHARQKPSPWPSATCRRLRSPSVLNLLRRLEGNVLNPQGQPPLLWRVDG